VVEAASNFAISVDDKDLNKYYDEFIAVNQGALPLVEDKDVAEAASGFAKCINKAKKTCGVKQTFDLKTKLVPAENRW
jgi:hypothetical protein